jgi:hypothetical protein
MQFTANLRGNNSGAGVMEVMASEETSYQVAFSVSVYFIFFFGILDAKFFGYTSLSLEVTCTIVGLAFGLILGAVPTLRSLKMLARSGSASNKLWFAVLIPFFIIFLLVYVANPYFLKLTEFQSAFKALFFIFLATLITTRNVLFSAWERKYRSTIWRGRFQLFTLPKASINRVNFFNF